MSDGEQIKVVVLLRRLLDKPGSIATDQILGRCEGAALAASLYLAEELDAHVTAIAVGPAKRENRVLAMALRAGCHEAIRVDASEVDELDYLGVATVIAEAIKPNGFDLVLCGDRAQDELQAAVGPAVAELLEVAHLPGVVGLHVEDGLVVARQRDDDCFHTYRCGMSSLLCVAAFKPPPKSAVQSLLEELDEPGEEPDKHEESSEHRVVSVNSGALSEVRLDRLDVDEDALKRRDGLGGVPRPAHHGAHATIVTSSTDLVSRLEDDRLL